MLTFPPPSPEATDREHDASRLPATGEPRVEHRQRRQLCGRRSTVGCRSRPACGPRPQRVRASDSLAALAKAGIDSRSDAHRAWNHFQRGLDFALVLATTPVTLTAVAVLLAIKWLCDGRPLFFAQTRLGCGLRRFRVFKIRTTPRGYRYDDRHWPTAAFPPRTRFGQWIRDRDLDELPQLWNVLKGEMSLVGPRPETPYHSARFAERFTAFPLRLTVRPGLTGLAQIRGLRGDTSIAARLRSDLEWIERQRFVLYVTILFQTLQVEARRWFGVTEQVADGGFTKAVDSRRSRNS